MRSLRHRWAALGAAIALALDIGACGTVVDSLPAILGDPVSVKLIALNDFHGHLEVPPAGNGGSVTLADPAHPAGTTVRTGGAAFLATLVKQLRAANPNNVVVGAGDMIGASPVTSALTHDEATVDVLDQIGLEVTSVGNHEFDHGREQLLRMRNGGCFVGGVVGRDTCLNGGAYKGAAFHYLSANVVDAATGKTLFPATWVKTFGTVSVGFVGLTLKGTPTVVTSTGVTGLAFNDEVTTINESARQLKAHGVSAVVVLIHQGGQTTATTLNDHGCPHLGGDILPIVDGLSADVDVVVSGHTHQEYVCTRNGKLLTQAGHYGSAVTEIDLTIQPGVGVTKKVANTRPVINDLNAALPNGYVALAKDPAIDAAVQRYVALSAGLNNEVVGSITQDIKRAWLITASVPTRDESAESPMGDVMADVYLSGGPLADAAFVNPGGVRADLIHHDGGTVTFGDLLAVSPFGNTLVTVDMTGTQIERLLEEQWEAPNCGAKQGANGCGRLLQPSAGFAYTWDAATPAGAAPGTGRRVVAGTITINGKAVDPAASYRITFNSFNAPGPGDNFTEVTKARNITDSGVRDIDAMVAYMKAHPNLAPPAARVTRLH